MLRFLPFSIILQAICLFHAFRTKAEQKWYWIILLFPVMGSLIYLYDHYYNRKNIEKFSTGLKSIINTNYELQQLEKAHRFSDSVQNKLRLADKYLDLKRYDEALELYSSCLEGIMKDDPKVLKNVVAATYLNGNYAECIKAAERLSGNQDFKHSEERICYAWALFHSNRKVEAEKEFEEMDHSFSNYPHRFEYIKFLDKCGKRDSALEKLDEVQEEYEQLGSSERRNKKWVMKTVKQVRASLG